MSAAHTGTTSQSDLRGKRHVQNAGSNALVGAREQPARSTVGAEARDPRDTQINTPRSMIQDNQRYPGPRPCPCR